MKISLSLNLLVWIIAGALAVLVVFQQWDRIASHLPSFSSSSASAVSGHPIVVVDVARLLNAQRRMAVQIGQPNEPSDAVSTVARAGRQASAVIREVAGPNAIVIVRQAVVSWPGKIPDITDEVVDLLGLPADTATIESPLDRPMPSNFTVDPKISDAKKRQMKALDDRYKPSEDSEMGDPLVP